MQVLFAILLAALGIAQAQMSFPDITQAAAAIERVFGTIDRNPSIETSADKGDQQRPLSVAGAWYNGFVPTEKHLHLLACMADCGHTLHRQEAELLGGRH